MGPADSSSEITMTPQPTEKEIGFILDAIAEYLTVRVRRSDVMSAWSGIRPLAVDPNAKDTASASRDHIVTTDPNGLITVTGISLCHSPRNVAIVHHLHLSIDLEQRHTVVCHLEDSLAQPFDGH